METQENTKQIIFFDHPQEARKPEYLNEQQVAELTGISLSKLQNDRYLHQGLPYIKISRLVRYDYRDIHRYMDERKVTFD